MPEEEPEEWVKITEVEEKQEKLSRVYKAGLALGKSVGITNQAEGETNVEEVQSGFSDTYPQSADYANNLLPTMREIAGCQDPMGVGTYTQCTEEQSEDVDALLNKYWEGINEGIKKAMTSPLKLEEKDK